MSGSIAPSPCQLAAWADSAKQLAHVHVLHLFTRTRIRPPGHKRRHRKVRRAHHSSETSSWKWRHGVSASSSSSTSTIMATSWQQRRRVTVSGQCSHKAGRASQQPDLLTYECVQSRSCQDDSQWQHKTGGSKFFSANITAYVTREMIARGQHALSQFGPLGNAIAFILDGYVSDGIAITVARRNFPMPCVHHHRVGHCAVTSPSDAERTLHSCTLKYSESLVPAAFMLGP
mmetsp:Transcript_104687/g.207985  ORF Transcript_104687/g.207985 Transcript_104687/m.207985 type:complete len:231 (+) Transcript_104687:2-694(+)